MSKIIQFIKTNVLDVFVIIAISILLLFLIKKMPHAMLAVIIHILLSFFALYKIQKKKELYLKVNSYFEFFSSLLTSINRNLSLKKSYELSSKYLISYHQILPYETFIEEQSFIYLKDYEKYCLQLLDDEKNNECHLKNYYLLINKIEVDISNRKRKQQIIEWVTNIIFGITIVLFLAIVILRFTTHINTKYSSLFIDVIMMMFSLIIPSIYLCKMMIMEKDNE